MKKYIKDEKIEEMLKKIYNSELSHNFQFNSNIISEKTQDNRKNIEISVSGSEYSSKKTFSPAKICAVAAAAIMTVSIGAFSLMENTNAFSPSSQFSENTETSLFDEYLKEFEYEINNFDYECIMVTPEEMYSDDENEQHLIETGNEIYTQLCYAMNIIPEYEGCQFINNTDGTVSLKSDSQFYCYIKKIGEYDYTENNEEYTADIYSRQSYLIWKDENGNITKIRPSKEKSTINETDFIESMNADSVINSNQEAISAMNNFNTIENDVYINDVLIREEIAKYSSIFVSKSISQYNYYMCFETDDKFIPVSLSSVSYFTNAPLNFENSDEICSIPLLYAYIDNGYFYFNKTFANDCSGNEIIDISDKIEEANNNYWLETAENEEIINVSEETVTSASEEVTSETVSEFNELSALCITDLCITDLVNIDAEYINNLIELYGDALQRTETGYTLCSYCLEQNGFNLENIQLYPNTYFTMTADEFYEYADTENKNGSGLCIMGNNTGGDALFSPTEDYRDDAYDYQTYKVEIHEDDYSLIVHFPLLDMQAYQSDSEAELCQQYHNRPWAELIIN